MAHLSGIRITRRIMVWFVPFVLCLTDIASSQMEGFEIPDLTAYTGKVFSLCLRSHPIYGDPQVDIEFSASSGPSSGGQLLPPWLNFNSTSKTLTGVPLGRDQGKFLITLQVSCASNHQHHELHDPVSENHQQKLVTKGANHCRESTDVFQMTVSHFPWKSSLTPTPLTSGQALLWSSETGSVEEKPSSSESQGCDGDRVVASLILCASVDALGAKDRMTLLTHLADFLSVPVVSINLESSTTRNLIAVENGFQIVSAGPGSDDSCNLNQNIEVLWALSCSTIKHLTDFVRVLQHNVDGGRVEAELKVGVVGWYVASSNSLLTRQNRRKRGASHRTVVPTPAIYPPRPTSIVETSQDVDVTTSISQISSLSRSKQMATAVPLSSPSVVQTSSIHLSSAIEGTSEIPTTPTLFASSSILSSSSSSKPLSSTFAVHTIRPSSTATTSSIEIYKSSSEVPKSGSLSSSPILPAMSSMDATRDLSSRIPITPKLPIPTVPLLLTSSLIQSSQTTLASPAVLESSSAFTHSVVIDSHTIIAVTPPLSPSLRSMGVASTKIASFPVDTVETEVHHHLSPPATSSPQLTPSLPSTFFVQSRDVQIILPSERPEVISTAVMLPPDNLTPVLDSSFPVTSSTTKSPIPSVFTHSHAATPQTPDSLSVTETQDLLMQTSLPILNPSLSTEQLSSGDLFQNMSANVAFPASSVSFTTSSVMTATVSIEGFSMMSPGLSSLDVNISTTGFSHTQHQTVTGSMPTEAVQSLASKSIISTPVIAQLVSATDPNATAELAITPTSATVSGSASSSLFVVQPARPSGNNITSPISTTLATTSTTTNPTTTEITTTTTSTTEPITIANTEETTEEISWTTNWPTDWDRNDEDDDSEEEPSNNRPFVQNSINLIIGEQGRLLEFLIPHDVFYDIEDGDTRTLTLSLELPSSQELPSNFWLYLEPNVQVLKGLPLHEDMDIKNISVVLVARDSKGLAARDSIALQINDAPRRYFTHRFTMRFAVDFQHFMRNRRNITELLDRIGKYFGDDGAKFMTVIEVRQGSFVLSWTNNTLTGTVCQERVIKYLLGRMVRRDGTVRSSFNRHVGRHLQLVEVVYEPRGSCFVPTTTTTTTTTTQIVSDTVDKNLSIWAHVILPVLIALLVFALIILIIYFCNRRRRQRLAILNAEKEAVSNDRNPIIFPDELEADDPSLKAKDPLVLPSDPHPSSPNTSPDGSEPKNNVNRDRERAHRKRSNKDRESERNRRHSKESNSGKRQRDRDRMSGMSAASSSLSCDRPNNHYLEEEEGAGSRSSTLNSRKSDKRQPKEPPPYWQSQSDPPPYRLPPPYLTNNTTQV